MGEARAAALVQLCADYIENSMLNASQMPGETALEALADVLASLEYYLEGGATLQSAGESSALDSAEGALERLGMQVPDAVTA